MAILHKLIQTHLLKRSALSLALYPVGLAYAALQKLRRKHLYKQPFKAPCYIISIGNIVSGGSGKTPLTIALARALQEKGIRIGISHRGYKGSFENITKLISDSRSVLYSAEDAGDEAYLIASAIPGIPVVVGRKRISAIQLLLSSYPATQVILMDDAFQHIKVFRDLNIISFSAETGLGNGFVLPAGYLRESLAALTGNDIAVIYRKQPTRNVLAWEEELAAKVKLVIHSYSSATYCLDPSGYKQSVQNLANKRLVLVSGIAHPASFENTVKGLGLSFSRHFAYPDHYAFNNENEIEDWLQEIPDIILSTQKDIMKLTKYPEISSRLRALVLDYHFEDDNLLTDYIIAQL